MRDWLKKHPSIEIIARDRSGYYALGARSKTEAEEEEEEEEEEEDNIFDDFPNEKPMAGKEITKKNHHLFPMRSGSIWK